MTSLHLTPLDQIILLAGLEKDEDRRARIWALPELRPRLERLAASGLVDIEPTAGGGRPTKARFSGLSDPDGLRAAQNIRFIALDDLMAEHLSTQP